MYHFWNNHRFYVLKFLQNYIICKELNWLDAKRRFLSNFKFPLLKIKNEELRDLETI